MQYIISAEETFWTQFDEAVGCQHNGLDVVFDALENGSLLSKRSSRAKPSTIAYEHKKKLAVKKDSKEEDDFTTVSDTGHSDKETEHFSQDSTGKVKTRKAKTAVVTKIEKSEPIVDEDNVPQKLKSKGSVTHVCEFCASKYRSLAALKKHDCPAIICTYCRDKVYDDVDLLVEHVNAVHHACNEASCDYYCDSANGLKYHFTNDHNKMPKYPCSKCDRVFKSNITLANHVPKCKSVKSETTHFCQFCEELFASKADKDEHECSCSQKPHTETHCKLCGKVCSDLETLKQHLCNDHGQGFALCQFCHKGFKTADALQVHQNKCNESSSKEQESMSQKRKTRSSGPAHD